MTFERHRQRWERLECDSKGIYRSKRLVSNKHVRCGLLMFVVFYVFTNVQNCNAAHAQLGSKRSRDISNVESDRTATADAYPPQRLASKENYNVVCYLSSFSTFRTRTNLYFGPCRIRVGAIERHRQRRERSECDSRDIPTPKARI